MAYMEPKVCIECDHHPYESENGFNDNGCTCEPRECALRKARMVKAARREAREAGITLDEAMERRRPMDWRECFCFGSMMEVVDGD